MNSIPEILEIEGSSKCNGKCTFCRIGQGFKRPSGKMTIELFTKIIKDATDLEIKRIFPSLADEPFLSSRIFERLQILREHGRETVVYTNGSLLTPDKADQLVEFSDVVKEIIINAAGIDEESHQRIQGLSFEQVKQNVEYLAQINNKRIPVYVHTPRMEANIEFLEQWKETWRGIVTSAQVTSFCNWGGHIRDKYELQSKRSYCLALDRMVVAWDGVVSICFTDLERNAIIGDLNQQTILEVYNSPEALHYRKMHKMGRMSELALCMNCNVTAF